MAFPATDLMSAPDDDFVEPPAASRASPVRRPRRRGITEEALAWGALVLLALGPLIGWLLATLL